MSASPFLRNQWYVAAVPSEVATAKPLRRTICNEPIVLFRGEDGIVGALTDRCPHRMAPLSSGEVNGDTMQCGYHGIRFNRDGSCAHVPGDLPAPRNFRARSFPVVEKHGFIFLWMGDKAADPALIPDFHENDDPAWASVPGYLHIACNYELMVDNILDLTHVVFVHKTTLAGGGVTETPLQVEVEGDRIVAKRIMHNVDTAPIYRAARGLNGKIDRWQMFEYQPPMYVRIVLGAREAGSDTPIGEPVHVVLNSFTPETDKSIHYFWTTARPWAIDDPKVSQLYREMIDLAFAEDAAIVAQQQVYLDTAPPGAGFVNFPFDRAGQSARRIVRRLLDEEAAEGARTAAE
ncbi:MAG: Vanillate O-demethylase monooxygenase subunit [Hyphomicrobiales bacterium]|nr:Vanillate O-demethylase monooxygenase subunit [Hyphomicrobiales bacterium]